MEEFLFKHNRMLFSDMLQSYYDELTGKPIQTGAIIAYDMQRMTELFRRLVIKYFQEKKLITERFAWNLFACALALEHVRFAECSCLEAQRVQCEQQYKPLWKWR